MALNSFSCPHCKKVLKSAQGVPLGTKVKCPGCTKIFAVVETLASSQQIKARPSSPPAQTSPQEKIRAAASKPAKKTVLRDGSLDDDDDEVARANPVKPGKKTVRADRHDEDAPRRKKRKASRDDDDEQNDDDNPRRGKKKPKKKESKTTLLIVGGALGLLLLIGGGIGLFLLLGSPGAGPPVAAGGGAPPPAVGGLDDPLAFLPRDANFVAAVNFGAMKNNTLFMKGMAAGVAKRGNQDETDVFLNSEFFYIAGKSAAVNGDMVAVLCAGASHDQEKIKRVFAAQPVDNPQKTPLFRDRGNGLIAFPSPKIMVMGHMPDATFLPLLDGKSSLPADLNSLARSAPKAMMWAIYAPDAEARKEFEKINPKDLAQVNPDLAGLAELLPIIQKAKSGMITFNVDDQTKKFNLAVAVACAHAGDAGKLHSGISNFWNGKAKDLLAFAQFFIPDQNAGKKLIDEITASARFDRDNTTVTVSVSISESTMTQLDNMGKPPVQPPANNKKPRPPRKIP